MGPEICEFHQQPSKQNEGTSNANASQKPKLRRQSELFFGQAGLDLSSSEF